MKKVQNQKFLLLPQLLDSQCADVANLCRQMQTSRIEIMQAKLPKFRVEATFPWNASGPNLLLIHEFVCC